MEDGIKNSENGGEGHKSRKRRIMQLFCLVALGALMLVGGFYLGKEVGRLPILPTLSFTSEADEARQGLYIYPAEVRPGWNVLRIGNNGDKPIENVTLALTRDGEKKYVIPAELKPHQQCTVRYYVPPDAKGVYVTIPQPHEGDGIALLFDCYLPLKKG